VAEPLLDLLDVLPAGKEQRRAGAPGWYGRELGDRDLAKMLRPFGVSSQLVRIKKGNARGAVRRGYRREPLQDAWERYGQGGDDD